MSKQNNYSNHTYDTKLRFRKQDESKVEKGSNQLLFVRLREGFIASTADIRKIVQDKCKQEPYQD